MDVFDIIVAEENANLIDKIEKEIEWLYRFGKGNIEETLNKLYEEREKLLKINSKIYKKYILEGWEDNE